MKIKLIVLLALYLILYQISSKSIIHLHTHKWCPPCKKAIIIFQKLQKNFPSISFEIHQYANKSLIYANDTTQALPFPTIVFQCNQHNFRYQNDLTLAQLSYWIETVCLKSIPECSDKINNELYRILLERHGAIQDELISEMMKHPHIKVCRSHQSNITWNKAVQILRDTDKKTLYFDYFSNNLRNYLVQSKKLGIAILTTSKNTSRVNSFLQSYISLNNFMNNQTVNSTEILYRYQLPQYYKDNLVFFELCYNINISKCIFRPERKSQVQNNQKNIEKLLHFVDISIDGIGSLQQIIAFRFNHPNFEKHIYHNLGIVDEKFMFWISEILSNKNKQKQKKHCYWNAITHRISQNSLEDIESYLRLYQYLQNRKKKVSIKPLPLSKIVKSYHSEPKITLCFEGKTPINYSTNPKIGEIIAEIQAYDSRNDLGQL